MDFIKKVASKKETIIDGVVLVLIASFLVSYFEPQYLLSKTTTTGGDTGSHYYTAWYLRYHLLPKGQITGWTQGNYAGFPMLLFYFPLPFFLMAALSWVMPLQIAFKLITVLGVFLLPLCSYGALRFMKYAFPIPTLGALFTLPFLFMEANSMWGGNIPSTLAGEFCFGIGMALAVLFLGSFYQGITTGKHVVRNAVLVFLIGFSHGYALLFAGLTSLFFLWTIQDFQKKFLYLFKVHTLGFLLLGFWIVPLLAYLPFNTTFNIIWVFQSFVNDVFPKIFYPFLVFALVAILLELYRIFWKKISDPRMAYLLYGIGVGIVAYFIGFYIGIADIRFLPFVQHFLMLLGAMGFHACIKNLKGQIVLPGIVYILVLFWVNHNVHYIPDWIAWNYNGFEKKNVWPQFKNVNERLRGSPGDPRVVYENSGQHNAVGTPRAFESLPFFAGRSTLEGLYMQASISAPFVFNIQSEISKEASCPFVQYSCTRYNMEKGIKHLEMFNARDVVAITPEIKADLARHPKFKRLETFPPYELYQLTSHENRYVVPLTNQPIFMDTPDWKTTSYQWFKDFKNNDIHLVFPVGGGDSDFTKFTAIPSYAVEEGTLLPRVPIDAQGEITEIIRDDEVLIETSLIHKPHLIKISYHPNWKVEGADRIYLVSPSFMLIYPTQNRVRLYYGQSAPEYIGKLFSLIGWGICFLSLTFMQKGFIVNRISLANNRWRTTFGAYPLISKMNRYFWGVSQWVEQRKKTVRRAMICVFIVGIGIFVLATYKQDATSLLDRGVKAKDSRDFAGARQSFKKIIERHPLAAITEHAYYYYAITYYLENNCEQTIIEFTQFVKKYPDANAVPEAHYHIGLCHRNLGRQEKAAEAFQFIISNFPDLPWAQYARDRLAERP